MFGLDELISRLGGGDSLAVALVVAFLLGLRHASDPDHLVAVSTVVAAERERATRRAARLGLSWGLGHASTVVALGLPAVLLGRFLPDLLQRGAEVLVGIVIVALALRLLVRWRRGRFHAHAHTHGALVHRHLHRHDDHGQHDHEHVVLRSAFQAYCVGLLHGAGGSAAVAVLLLGSIESRAAAAAALLVFAFGTALSMGLLSSGLGFVLGRGAVGRRFERLVPVLGASALVFGLAYAAAGLGV